VEKPDFKRKKRGCVNANIPRVRPKTPLLGRKEKGFHWDEGGGKCLERHKKGEQGAVLRRKRVEWNFVSSKEHRLLGGK